MPSLWKKFKDELTQVADNVTWWDNKNPNRTIQVNRPQQPQQAPVQNPAVPRGNRGGFDWGDTPTQAPVGAPAAPSADFTNKFTEQPVKPPEPKKYWQNPIGKAVNTVLAGSTRAAAGLAQDAGGLYDLVTPGEGTNRVTDRYAERGKMYDEMAKEAGINQTAYKAAQVPLNVAAFLLPSQVASGVSKVPAVANVVNKANAATEAFPAVAKATTYLDDAAETGSKTAKAVKWATSKPVVTNVAADSLQSAGMRTSRNQDNSPLTAATDVATSYGAAAGLSVAGDVLGKGVRKVVNAVDNRATPGFNKLAPLNEVGAIGESVDPITDLQSKLPRGYRADKTGSVFDPKGKELTLAEVQGLTQPKYLTDYEAASNVKDEATMSKIAAQHPDDIRVHIHESGNKWVTPLNEVGAISATPPPPKVIIKKPPTPVDAPNISVGKGSDSLPAVKIFNESDNQTPKIDEMLPSLRLRQKLSPDRIIRENVTQPVEEFINKGIYKASTSNVRILRNPARAIQGFGREIGTPQELLQARRRMTGGGEYGKVIGSDITKMGENLDEAARSRVWATLDPEQAAKIDKTANYDDLSPEEKFLADRIKTITAEVTDGNLQRGLITTEQASNPNYLTRGYEPFEDVQDKAVYDNVKQNLLKQFKGRKELSDDLAEQVITDPAYLAGKKLAQSHQAWAAVDYGNFLSNKGYAFDTPRNGMVQLPNTKLYGDAAGKWVAPNIAEDFRGFQYSNAILNGFNDFISAYDKIGLRQAKKQMLTIFNPAVRGGNQISNRVVFSTLNGLNPVEYNAVMQTTKKLIKNRDPLYLEAVQEGLIGTDITRAEFTQRIASYTDDPNVLKKANEWVKSSYSQADDRAKLSAYIIHRKEGYDGPTAAKMTQRGFQDYNSVGFFYDMAAKTPLIGNAFVRFAGDATRIMKNALVDHPLRTLSVVGMYGALNEIMSNVSGETDEDKKTREGRFGAPKIPFTDISLTTQTPWGEVNVARFMPFYQLNDIGGSINKFMPVAQNPLRPQGWQDPLLGQVGQVIKDKDFRGKSIQDPDNTVDEKGNKRYEEELPQDQKNKNVARFLASQNIPLGREADSIISAVKGEEDIYGKKRSLPQAALRAIGIKNEEFGPEQAKKNRETSQFMDERKQLDKQLETLPKAAGEAYKRLAGYSKLREKVPNEFEPGTMRDKKAAVYNFSEDKWKDYTNHPELYDLMKNKKIEESKVPNEKGINKPLQPEFDERLSDDFRKQLINNKSLAPGEDAEADARLFSSSEFDTYQQLKKEYKENAKKYYPKSDEDFVDELVKNKDDDFPEKPAALKAYGDAYNAYKAAGEKGEKPQFNDQLAAEKAKYTEDQRTWTNNARKKRGLPPISQEVWNNVTFGFESDEEKVYKELKYGKGFGGGKGDGYGGGGGSYQKSGDFGRTGALTLPSVKIKVAKVKIQAKNKPKTVKMKRAKKQTS